MVFTTKENSIKSLIILSFTNLSKKLLEPYFTLKSALFTLKVSLVKVTVPLSVETIAGIVMLFSTSLIFKFPVTANFPSLSSTEVITNVEVGYFLPQKSLHYLNDQLNKRFYQHL